MNNTRGSASVIICSMEPTSGQKNTEYQSNKYKKAHS